MTTPAAIDRSTPAGRKPADRKPGGILAIAVLASLLASTCCVLPLVLVLAGVTGAWLAQLQALKPFTPYAIGLTVAALAWSGWLAFRPMRACDLADGACATTRPVMRRVWIGCALFIGALLGFPMIAPLFY